MTTCVETTRSPDDHRLTDVATILAAGILRLRERQSLPVRDDSHNPVDSPPARLELSGETVLSVVQGG
jgi:hypothetical protein